MFDKKKRAITKPLGCNSKLVASFEPGGFGESFTLFVGSKAEGYGYGGVVNDDPPVQLKFELDELSDLKDFIEEAFALQEKAKEEDFAEAAEKQKSGSAF